MKPSLFLGYMGLHPVLRQADDLQRSLAERCLRICTPSTRAIRAGHCGRLHMTSALYPRVSIFPVSNGICFAFKVGVGRDG